MKLNCVVIHSRTELCNCMYAQYKATTIDSITSSYFRRTSALGGSFHNLMQASQIPPCSHRDEW